MIKSNMEATLLISVSTTVGELDAMFTSLALAAAGTEAIFQCDCPRSKRFMDSVVDNIDVKIKEQVTFTVKLAQ